VVRILIMVSLPKKFIPIKPIDFVYVKRI